MANERSVLVEITYDTLKFFGECTRLIENTFNSALSSVKNSPSSPSNSNPSKPLFNKEIFAPILKPIFNSPQAVSPKGNLSSTDVPYSNQEELYRAQIYVKDYNSPSAISRRDALDQIKKLTRPIALSTLKSILSKEQNEHKQIEVLNAISALSGKEDTDKEFFKRYLPHAHPHIRLAALGAISKFKDEESMQILATALKDPHADIREQSLKLLYWSYGDRCIPLIMRLLHDMDDRVRKSAIEMCGVLKAHQAVTSLITLLTDENKDIQKCAEASLRKITRENFGFNIHDSQKKKDKAVEQWRLWWMDNQATFGITPKVLNDNEQKTR